MLLVMCGRKVDKLGGQDRRWLKVANILLADNKKVAAVINRSYFELALKTRIATPERINVLEESRNKYASYIKHNILVVVMALKFKKVHYCGNALELTPSAVLLFFLFKKISFSFNGVSINYLAEKKQYKAILLLKIMSTVASRIEVLNKGVLEGGYFPRKKTFLSNAMYAGGGGSPKLKQPRKIVFAGHLYPLKGLPMLADIIKFAPSEDYQFFIYGALPANYENTETSKTVEGLNALPNVLIQKHQDDMSDIYSDAPIVLSLQTISNYPSQVVLEGLAAGAAAVIVDTGDSRRFGDAPGVFYFSDKATVREIWGVIVQAEAYSLRNHTLISTGVDIRFGPQAYVENLKKNLGLS